MPTISTPRTTASAQELANAHMHLIAAFAINFVCNFANYFLAYAGNGFPDVMVTILPLISLGAAVYLCVALYMAATKLGFSQLTVILSLILSFLVSLLGLILVVSADIRLTRKLRQMGWKVGLFGAKPA